MSRIAQALSKLINREVDDPLLGPPQGLFSGKDAVAAIRFALEIDDHYDMREFLKGWLEGDTREWPEFKPDILVLPPGALA